MDFFTKIVQTESVVKEIQRHDVGECILYRVYLSAAYRRELDYSSFLPVGDQERLCLYKDDGLGKYGKESPLCEIWFKRKYNYRYFLEPHPSDDLLEIMFYPNPKYGEGEVCFKEDVG